MTATVVVATPLRIAEDPVRLEDLPVHVLGHAVARLFASHPDKFGQHR